MERENSTPKAKILRSANSDFIGAYPIDVKKEFPSKYPCEDMFLHGSVASACDCTGIAVVQPRTPEEAAALEDIAGTSITYHE